MTSKTARAVDQQESGYTFSLRVKHPSVDPEEITRALGISPDHAWACGEPRRSESGAVLGGIRRNSYWSGTLPSTSLRELAGQWMRTGEGHTPPVAPQVASTMLPLSSHLALQLLLLRRHRSLIERLTSDGGEVSLVVEAEPDAGMTLVIEPALARQIADTGLRLEFQLG